jgi:Peptidase family C25
MTPRHHRDHRLTFNGVNGATGEYGLPRMTGEELARFLSGEAPPENLRELRSREEQREGTRHLGVMEGIDAKRLDQAGWGVIFTHGADPAVREALAPLLDLRREQAGDRFKIYEGSGGYQPGEAKGKFLARYGMGPGPANPEKVPYYLLLVGSPEQIPYRFQSQLDVQYAVGRLHFDRVEDYAHYARSVVAAETGKVELPRRVSFFSVENADDFATQLSTGSLVEPLLTGLSKARPDWQMSTFLREGATKANLSRLLGGGETPALLFTSSHGMEFPLDDPRQRPHQGALLCGDWPGPEAWRDAIPQDFYFAGDDVTAEASLHGLMTFHFACYGAGTPRLDDFAQQAFKERSAIAPEAFLSALPTRLLSHPRGGALAVIGHVERAWSYSFEWEGASAQTTVFESALRCLLDGRPVGMAMEYLNARYAELSTMLADQLEETEAGAVTDPYELAGLWTANNDARGYAILGDPAVRLTVAGRDSVRSPG